MKKLQENPWGKLLAVVLLLVTAFGAGLFAVKGIVNFSYVAAEDWQETSRFYELLWERQQQMAQLCSLEMQLAEELPFAEQQQKSQTLSQLKKELQSDATWFRWQVFDANGQNILYSNLNQEELSQTVETIHYATFAAGENQITSSAETRTDAVFYGEMAEDATMNEWEENEPVLSAGVIPAVGEQLIIQCGVPEQVDETIQDDFFDLWRSWGENRANFQPNLVRAGVLALLSLGCFLFILWTAGHKEGEEGIVLTWQERIFFDLYLPVMIGAMVGIFLLGLMFGDYLIYRTTYGMGGTEFVPLVRDWLLPLTAALMVGAVTLTVRTLTVRLKARALARSTLLCRVLMWCLKVLRDFILALPFT